MILKYKEKIPVIEKTALVMENATVVGDVKIGSYSSVWFYAIIRGDLEKITVGNHTSVQDGVVIHVAENLPTKVGNYDTIGHNAILHGCTIGDYSLIGSGANILDGVVIGNNVIIAAGTVVTPRTVIPDNSMVMGIPGKVQRNINEKEMKMLKEHAECYVELMKNYKQ